jgi:hypothetical protein
MNIFVKICSFVLILTISNKIIAQDRSDIFLNAGIITNLEKCSECEKADTGGSIRIGILTKEKMGYYAGYIWFNEYHLDFIEYDDEGTLVFGGIGYLFFKRGNFRTYLNFGLGIEDFKSTYPDRIETESSIKPDIGFLINLNKLNAYLGWQPSDPSHYNIGIGFTI